jgi:hypothetical protein
LRKRNNKQQLVDLFLGCLVEKELLGRRSVQALSLLGSAGCAQFPSRHKADQHEDTSSGVTLGHHVHNGGVDNVQGCAAAAAGAGGRHVGRSERIGAGEKAAKGNNDAKELVHGGLIGLIPKSV